ncbi:DJ-1/PfpI family protein [Dokdonella soli]|uniref:DJ-1/PfpI domain-containing protein n=1 Tax=Dokdonella soli TaxID=529810 RepID=A0ABP3TX34_9GAMM
MPRTIPFFLFAALSVNAIAAEPTARTKLSAPEHGSIPVAFVVTEGAAMIDFAGPWEVFQDVMVPARGSAMADQHVFKPYVVSDSIQPLRVSGGMTVTPDYTFDNAPVPKIVVVPAQRGDSPKMMEWLRNAAAHSDVVMSVCTGAFKLAKAGLLDGKPATTHHGYWVQFQHEFPNVRLQRDMRFVQSDSVVYTAGGLSSGIDLALHIVDGYFGRDIAAATARRLEYESAGWIGGGTSAIKYSEPVAVHSPADRYREGAFGNWRGNLASSDGTFRVAVHLWPDAQGKPTGTVDGIDEDMNGTPIDSVKIDGDAVTFANGGSEGRFTGKLDAKHDAISGTWTQNQTTLPLKLTRVQGNSLD